MDTSAAGERVLPTLMMTVYDAHTGKWTDPTPVQNDGTVDAAPNLCDAGDQVLISWASAGKAEYASEIDRLADMDICAVLLDKDDADLGEIEQLTDDEYLDTQPSAIYDDETGSLAVYYIKHIGDPAACESAVAYAMSDSIACYRLYEKGAWITNYYEAEYPDQDLDALSAQYGGQRFLTASLNGRDLPIRDLAVCSGYNGLGIYAYTIDTDGDIATDGDQELFLRVYDFRTHKTYDPIRITNDKLSQALPQLVRNNLAYTDFTPNTDGETETETTVPGTTYLFWMEDSCAVKYISVTDLLRHGINPNGTLKENYTLSPTRINTELENGGTSTLSSYQALTDEKDNLYILWTQACVEELTEENRYDPAALEIYAAAQVHSQSAGSKATLDEDGMVSGGTVGSTWSAPYRLTTDGKCNDGLFGTVAENGKLYILHNRYTARYVEETEADEEGNRVHTGGHYETGRVNLMMTSFEPIGTVSATAFAFSDTLPCAGDTVTVTAKVENTGLTTAEGYTLNFYESRDGEKGKLLFSQKEQNWLAANTSEIVRFDWTVPADFADVKILCEAQENGYSNVSSSFSSGFAVRPDYTITLNSVKQNGDHFTADYTVTNCGNAAGAAEDSVEISFAGLYGAYDQLYGLETPLLATEALNGLAVGESLHFTTDFTVPESAFDYCGYDRAVLTVTDREGNALCESAGEYLILETPIAGEFDETCLTLSENEQTDLKVQLGSSFLQSRSTVLYSVSDPTVAAVDQNGRVVGLAPGSTEITAYILPYGTTVTATLTVSGHSGTSGGTQTDPTFPFTDVAEGDYFFDAVAWGVRNGIASGVTETRFDPNGICTRAEMVTFLWRTAGCPKPASEAPFTDVKAGSWYAEAVAWATEQAITLGIGDNLFGPSMTVTRAQAVTFLARFAKADLSGEQENHFIDVLPEKYYYGAVSWAEEHGITNGVSEDMFAPGRDCTRAQIVTFLYRFEMDKN